MAESWSSLWQTPWGKNRNFRAAQTWTGTLTEWTQTQAKLGPQGGYAGTVTKQLARQGPLTLRGYDLVSASPLDPARPEQTGGVPVTFTVDLLQGAFGECKNRKVTPQG